MTGLIDRKMVDLIYDIEHVPGLTTTDISFFFTGMPSSSAVMTRLCWLFDNGLISKNKGVIINSMMVRLTDKGKSLARSLHRLDAQMGWDELSDDKMGRWRPKD